MDDLSKLAIKFGTDKWESHFYTQHYDKNFSKFKNEKIKLLEIGVGGYSHKDLGGNSLRMWKEYFPMGQIFAFDIVNKTITGSFYFNSYDESGFNYMNFSEGIFFKVPYMEL